MTNKKFSTRTVHAGQGPDPVSGAITTPIYQTATYVLDEIGKDRGYQYSRTNNPTRTVLQDLVANLEGSKYAVAFSTGMATVDAVVRSRLKSGDHVVCFDDAYGGVYRLFEQSYKKFGVEVDYVDMRDKENVRKAIKENTKLVWLETPTNPLLKVADVEGICTIVAETNEQRDKDHKIFSVIDNTFMTPYFLKPFTLGCDVVIHSMTKFMSGHNQLVGGMAVIRDDPSRWYYQEIDGEQVNTLHEDIKFIQNTVGSVPSPQDCYLSILGIKTLALRMEKHNANALEIMKFLQEHPKVSKIYYPGLPSHTNHDIAQKQMTGFGGMMSFELDEKYGLEGGKKVMNSVKLWSLAESLGAVESMVTHPASMTHAAVPAEVRQARGISDGLIRLSVGIEDVADLIADLKQALDLV